MATHGSIAGGSPQTGTTIVACTYPGGVVIGADGKVSVGRYVSNRASNKITPLSANTFLLRSGSAPDTQAIADFGAPLCVARALLQAGGRRRGALERDPAILRPPSGALRSCASQAMAEAPAG